MSMAPPGVAPRSLRPHGVSGPSLSRRGRRGVIPTQPRTPACRARDHRAMARTKTQEVDADLLEEIAEELYALPPAEFVAVREERARSIRDEGDRGTANAVHGLRRPTQGAWLVNLLARDESGLLTQLLDVGAELRAAQE